MQLSISAQHINKLGSSLQEYVNNKVQEVIKKYLEDVLNTAIHFSKGRSGYDCKIVVTRGLAKQILKSSDHAHDIYMAFDKAMMRLEAQLRKYKSKLKNHQKEKVKHSTIELTGTKYILNPYIIEADNDDQEEIDNNPVIIAEKPIDIETLSINEAVMKMDLEHLPALMFVHSGTGRVNIIYYRNDGNISWVDASK